MEKKNQVLMTVLGVFALVIVTVGVSYAFFTYSRTSQTSNTINTNTKPISFGFTESGQIALVDAVALPVEQGKALTDNVYTININANMPANSTVEYRITAINNTNPSEGKKALGNEQVRAYLTKADTPVWADGDQTKLMSEIITAGTEGLLHSFTVDTSDYHTINDTYNLRIWLDKAANNDINANDGGTGVIENGTNYETEDGKTVTSTQANKTYSLQIRVDASAVAKTAK